MYKFLVLASALVAIVYSAPAPGGIIAAPVIAAPLAVAHSVPVATSYANTYKVSVKSPVIATAPVAYAAAPAAYLKTAPIAYTAHAAPLAYAAAPTYVHTAPVAYGYGAAYIH